MPRSAYTPLPRTTDRPFQTAIQNAVALYERGNITTNELYAILPQLHIASYKWAAIEAELRASGKLAEGA